MRETRIEMQFDSDLSSLSLIGGVTRHLCEYIGLSQQEAYNVELCLVEAVTNSIRHGYEEQPGHEVRLSLAARARELVIEVEDTGHPLEEARIAEAQERARSEDALLEEGGRGLFIMESLMDDVSFGRADGRNRVTMRKNVESLSGDRR